MAIAEFPKLFFQPFGTPPLDGKPTGLFGASKSSTGDGTGGNNVIAITNGNSRVPESFIFQYDSVIIKTTNATLKDWSIVLTEGGLYEVSLSLGGGFFLDQSQSIRELAGYIQFPIKGTSGLLTFTTANVDTKVDSISVRGRYWERSYLRQRGETPAFL